MKLVRHLFQTCVHIAHTRNFFIYLSHGRKITAPDKKLSQKLQFSNSQVNNEILFLTGNGVTSFQGENYYNSIVVLLTQDQEGRG